MSLSLKGHMRKFKLWKLLLFIVDSFVCSGEITEVKFYDKLFHFLLVQPSQNNQT